MFEEQGVLYELKRKGCQLIDKQEQHFSEIFITT